MNCTAKIRETVAEKPAKPVAEREGSDLKKYGYRIQLLCHVSVDELEWTTETTDEKLVTTATTKTSFFKRPEPEIDPE